jgi:phage terminase large subunit
MPFQLTTAVKKMLRMTGNKKVIQGSTSSGKTYGIIPILYDKALSKPRTKITVVAETLPALKDGCIDIFKNFMMDEGRWNDSQWNGTDMVYKALNGSTMQFKSFDSVGKAKAAGKRDILFLNEANHIDYGIADALIIRSNEVWMDFNADMEFWAHTEILTQPDSEFLKLTYLDNEGIPDAVLNNLMQRKAKAEAEERNGTKGYWWNWWQVYGLGEVGMLQEAVYPRWEILSERPERFTRFIYGLDFGFQHPTALVKVWFWEDELFLEEVIYKSGLTSNALIDEMRKKEVSREVEIMCDYARPEMIEDLDNAGFYVLKADKSVEAGINFLNQMKVYVHADSINIQRENRLYKRKVMNGIISEQIDKKNDDAMDAARYAAMEIKSAFYGGSAYESF